MTSTGYRSLKELAREFPRHSDGYGARPPGEYLARPTVAATQRAGSQVTRPTDVREWIGLSGEIAMASLRALLERSGYRQLYPLVAGGGLFAADSRRARTLAEGLAPEHASLLELFALGEAVPREQLSEELAATVADLERAQLVTVTSGTVCTNAWVIVPVLGGLLLTGTPPAYSTSTGVGASAYLGPDSLRLAAALPDASGRRVLDLGSGCGVQGLLAIRGAREVVCSDIELRSLELTALNSVLNGVSHLVRIAHGDCYEPLRGERFDLIVSLPPYVPEVEGSATRSTVASGRDGLDVLRRLLAGASEHLSPHGELVARCQLLCGDDGPLIASELEALTSGLDCRLVLSDWHPLQPYLVELATSLSAHGSTATPRSLMDSYSASLRGLGATGMCSALVVVRRTGGSEQPGHGHVEIVGQVPPLNARMTPALVTGVGIAVDAGSRTAVAPGGPPQLLDGPTAALLSAVDGTSTVPELVARAWGEHPDAVLADLVDQALMRLDKLNLAGLVKL